MSDQVLEAYLAKLEDQRARLDIQIAGLRVELGLDPSEVNGAGVLVASPAGVAAVGTVGKPVVTGRVRSDEFFRMSIPEAVKRYLEIMKQPQSPTAIVAALKAGGVLSQSKNFYTTVWTAMRRLRGAGELVNIPTGWALSDWYPNKPKGGGDEKKPRKGKKRPKATQKRRKFAKPPEPGRAGGWHSFLAEQLKAGKTMKEAAEEWRKIKGDR